jgi:hypothetical protein
MFFFIDGINEFTTSLSQNQLLTALLSMQARHGANLCVTSAVRYRVLDGYQSTEFRASDDDISSYANDKATGLPPGMLEGGRIKNEDVDDIRTICAGK